MTELKKWITTALLTLLLLPAMAQQKADTTYTFRFVPQKDMFYVPWNGNDMELARLLECIESNKTDILDGKLPLYVEAPFTKEFWNVKGRKRRARTLEVLRAYGDSITVRGKEPVKTIKN